MVKIGALVVQGTAAVKVYCTRTRMGQVTAPLIAFHISEVYDWLRLREEAVVRGVNVDAQDHPVMSMLRAVPGVAYVLTTGYQVIIVKAQLYEWARD